LPFRATTHSTQSSATSPQFRLAVVSFMMSKPSTSRPFLIERNTHETRTPGKGVGWVGVIDANNGTFPFPRDIKPEFDQENAIPNAAKYQCKICGQQFNRPYMVGNHVSRIHYKKRASFPPLFKDESHSRKSRTETNKRIREKFQPEGAASSPEETAQRKSSRLKDKHIDFTVFRYADPLAYMDEESKKVLLESDEEEKPRKIPAKKANQAKEMKDVQQHEVILWAKENSQNIYGAEEADNNKENNFDNDQANSKQSEINKEAKNQPKTKKRRERKANIQSKDLSNGDVIQMKKDSLRMLRAALSCRMITEQQFQQKQEEFLASIVF